MKKKFLDYVGTDFGSKSDQVLKINDQRCFNSVHFKLLQCASVRFRSSKALIRVFSLRLNPILE